MNKNRYINTKFWDDNYVTNLDPIEKLLFIYLLTNSLTNIAGIYEIALRRIAFDTGIDKDMVKRIIDRFSEDKKVYYVDSWVIMKNFLKHQKKNPKIEKGIKAIIDDLPDNIQIAYQSLSKPLNYSNSNSNSNSNNNKKYSPESKALFNSLKDKGINIYALKNKLKKERGWAEDMVPEDLLVDIARTMIAKINTIKKPFPYFKKVLSIEATKRYGEKSRMEGEKHKKEDVAPVMKEIMAGIIKEV